jgi:hypothetical protein
VIFAALIAGHMLGDWIVQTDWQAANKTTSWRANQMHVATYHLTLLAAVGWYAWRWELIPALAASWVLHSFIDRRWPVKRLLQLTRSPAFAETSLGILTADQTLHVVTLALMAAWLSH